MTESVFIARQKYSIMKEFDSDLMEKPYKEPASLKFNHAYVDQLLVRTESETITGYESRSAEPLVSI
tara:strand:+ start:41 stop:241 length:201 start_codon:yes stop_codon:yes gene_type:complete